MSKEEGELLLTLCQGPGRVSEFTLEFLTIVAWSGWNDIALQAAFRQGLNREVLTEIACHSEPLILDSLIKLAICPPASQL